MTGEWFGKQGEVVVYSDGTWTWTPDDADWTPVSRQVLDDLLTKARRVRDMAEGGDRG